MVSSGVGRLHMRFLSFIFGGLCLLVCSAPVSAQQWCSKANKPDELAICSDSELGQLDQQLSSAFAALRDGVPNRQPVIDQQRSFLKRRALCGADHACIRAEHQKQITLYSGVASKLGISLPLAAPAIAAVPPSTTERSSQQVQIDSISIDYGPLGAAGNAMDALVVANWDYAELDTLKTPDADAVLVSSALATRGIAARIERNVGRQTLLDALAKFADSPRKDVFIFYYAGHAANINGNSSLLLPSFRVKGGTSNGEYIPISAITNTISKLGYKKALIIFDACRNIIDVNDPQVVATVAAEYQNTRSVKALTSRSMELAALKDMDYAISFSSAEGQTALDTVNGQNSPFAQAFASNLREKDTFFDAIIETRRDVRKVTNDRQRPTLEMSWDEDLTLSGNLLKSVEYSFNDGVTARIDGPSEDTRLVRDAPNSRSIQHKMTADDPCRRAAPMPGVASFDSSVFNCVSEAYHLKAASNDTISGRVNFFPERSAIDDHVQICSSAKFVFDLDLDGRPEIATFSQDRYGGVLTFERDGHIANYYSRLGCNFWDLTVYDLDKNGVADLIIPYACEGEQSDMFIETCLVVLSGERLISNVDGTFQGSSEANLERYFKKSKYLGLLGGLNRVALFYDEGIRDVLPISPAGLGYVGYFDTWEIGRENRISTKQARIARDGSITLQSDGDTYTMPNLQSDKFALKKIN